MTRLSRSDRARQHYDIEVELAHRLRHSAADERRNGLYNEIYAERLARIPSHPLAERARDPARREDAARMQLRLVDRFLTPRAVFVEIGPGDCALAAAVAERVRQVYAVDVNHDLAEAITLPTNLVMVKSDGASIPVPPASVDIAYSNQLLEHLHPDDARDHLREVFAALAPGGRYVCITPNRLSGPWDISRNFDETATGLHLREYTLSELADAFRDAGFDVSLLASYHGHVPIRRVPESPVRAVEFRLGQLPFRARRWLAAPLTAVKLVGTKPS